MSGAHVVISGGGTGVGAETARQFAQAGYKVTILGRTEATLKAQGLPYQICDVTDADAVKAAFDGARTEQGPITVVVANAGAATSVPFAKMNAADLTAMTDVNLTGVFNTIHPIWPGMRERKFGRIVVISSINGQKGQFAQVNYAATKAGDLGIVKSLAQEGARAGITANAICPGYIGTDMVMAVPEKVRESIIAQIPAGRLGEPEEIARCVAFLVSDDAAFINGSTISANGAQFFV